MRITSRGQANHVYHHQRHKVDKATWMPKIDTGGDHVDRSISGYGMDGIEVSPEMLRMADRQLAQAQADLEGYKGAAKELHGSLGDGSGPVAATMRKAFLDRASLDGGVQDTLQNYIDEITNVRMAIAETLTTYEDVDGAVADQFNQQTGEQA